MVHKSKDWSIMDLATLFSELQEYEIVLNRLAKSKQVDKKKKNLALKAT